MNPIEHITVRPRQRDHVVVEPSVFREFGIRRGIPPKEDEVIEAVNDGKLYYFTVPRNPHVMFAKRIEFVANDESQHVIERGIPYIHGEGRVIIPAAVRRGQLFTNGGGIENMVVTASKWDGIDRWRGYWDHAMEHRSTRQIPGWAKQAATNS